MTVRFMLLNSAILFSSEYFIISPLTVRNLLPVSLSLLSFVQTSSHTFNTVPATGYDHLFRLNTVVFDLNRSSCDMDIIFASLRHSLHSEVFLWIKTNLPSSFFEERQFLFTYALFIWTPSQSDFCKIIQACSSWVQTWCKSGSETFLLDLDLGVFNNKLFTSLLPRSIVAD